MIFHKTGNLIQIALLRVQGLPSQLSDVGIGSWDTIRFQMIDIDWIDSDFGFERHRELLSLGIACIAVYWGYGNSPIPLPDTDDFFFSWQNWPLSPLPWGPDNSLHGSRNTSHIAQMRRNIVICWHITAPSSCNRQLIPFIICKELLFFSLPNR